MDKNTYTAGETAQIHVEVRNDSAVDIDNFAVKVGSNIGRVECASVATLQLQYIQTSLIRSSFIRIPRHPEENR